MRFDRRTQFSIILIFALVILNIAITNMLSPVCRMIKEEFVITDNQLGFVDGWFLLMTAGSALAWGFYTDRVDRVRVLMLSGIVWTVGAFLTGFAPTYEILVYARVITGAGAGSILPLAYSIVGDLVREEERAGMMGSLAVISSLSNGLGRLAAGFFAPVMGWRSPFIVFALCCMALIPLLFFVRIPARGKTETVFKELEGKYHYEFTIRKEHVKQIVKQKTNFLLLIQGFISIIPGTAVIYFLIRLFDMQLFQNTPTFLKDVRLPAATILGGLAGVGYFIGNFALSAITDKLYAKNRRNRALMSIICTAVVVPLIFIAYFIVVPVDLSSLGAAPGITSLQLVSLILQQYPIYWAYLILANIASFFTTGFTFNRDSTMIDVNLPEHRGTAGSLYTFTEQIGKGITELLGWTIVGFLGSTNILGAMEILTLLWIPCIPLWYLVMKDVKGDIAAKEKVLGERLAAFKETSVKR